MKLAPITMAVHTLGRDSRQELIDDVRTGLTRASKSLPPRWFYDEHGSWLFEEITRLPEYYQARTEIGILERYAADIVGRTATASIVELGSGSCTKSTVLIRAAKGMGTLWTFVPFDISEPTLRESASRLAEEFDDLSVYCVTGDFDQHLSEIPRFGSQLLVFLGSTIGNFEAGQTTKFLADVRRLLKAGDHFLLGVDLVKDENQLVAAYDDAQGVTARFNLNLLARINRELGADFDLGSFEHVALWNAEETRIEMHLRSTHEQTVCIPAAELTVGFGEDELLRTELCTKYTTERVEGLLETAGMQVEKWYFDPDHGFGLVLAF
jgi:L-histidine N-alpha-methyltransferase